MTAVRKIKSHSGSDGDVERVGNTGKRLTFTVKNDREKILLSLNIPQDLKTEPGNPTMPSEERFFSYAFPETLFFRNTIYELYDAYVARYPHFRKGSIRAKEKYGEDLEYLRNELWGYHEKSAALVRDPSSNLTEEFRQKAKDLGFDVLGITAFDRKYIYSEFRGKVKYKNLVIVGLEQDWQGAQNAPSPESYMSNFPPSINAYRKAIEFADWVRSKGYPVQFQVASQGGIQLSRMPIHPYAVKAGLGQMGANGQILTPLFGSRVRMVAFSTDAPVRYDQPIDYGVNKLCEKCQVCVQRCPGRALPKTKVWWRGVYKYKTIADRCVPMLARYEGCSVCIKVCPVQRYGLKSVLDHYRETGEIQGKGTDTLEGYTLFDKGHFGSGQMPKFSVEDGGKGMIAMAKKLGITEGIRRERLGHLPGLGLEASPPPGTGRVDI